MSNYKCNKCRRPFDNISAFIKHKNTCKLNKKIIYGIRYDYVYNHLSTREVSAKYNISTKILKYVLKDFMRDNATAMKLLRSKNTESYTHSDITKDVIRENRLKWLRENTDWNLSYLSPIEESFLEIIKNNAWNKTFRIVKDKSVEYDYQPYNICFAFENQKVAIELDSETDNISEIENVIEDYKQLKISELVNDGWKVFRYNSDTLANSTEELKHVFNSNLEIDSKDLGIIIEKSQYELIKERNRIEADMYGLTKKEIISYIKKRKVERPDYKTLMEEIDELGYTGTGKKYGVSDTSIRKWRKWYEKNEK
jgi:very-short-patch-repair endonuclease